jgi:hypothetical protein
VILGPPGEDGSFWTYLKRSVEREDSYIIFGEQDHLVNLDLFVKVMAPHSTRGKSHDKSLYRLQEIFATSVLSFLLRIYNTPSLPESYLRYAAQYLVTIYEQLGLQRQGSAGYWRTNVKQGNKYSEMGGLRVPLVNSILMNIPDRDQWYLLRQDPIQRFNLMHPRGEYRVAVMVPRSSYVSQAITNQIGSVSEGVYGRGLKLLKDLGYIRVEDVMRETDLSADALNAYVALRDRSLTVLRRVEVLRTIPDTLTRLLIL